jgi:hypothetical protein
VGSSTVAVSPFRHARYSFIGLPLCVCQAKEEVEQALADQSGEAARVDEENTMLKAQLEQVTGTLIEEQAAKLEANRHLSQVEQV